MKQRTIERPVRLEGKALHTGAFVKLIFKPAGPNTGIVFKRVDLESQLEIKPSVELVTDLVRGTTIQFGGVVIRTIEHVLGAIMGLNIDNIIVELNAEEPPVLDGSVKLFAEALSEAQIVEQAAERDFIVLKKPISVSEGNRTLVALPYNGLKISCTLADDQGIHTQHLSLEITPDAFLSRIASARTFVSYEDIEPLFKSGKIKGGSLDCAIVIKGESILSKEPLRFKDEFVRHKILDIIGDLALLGKPLKAHIIGVRTGHQLNTTLVKAIRANEAEGSAAAEEKTVERSTQPASLAEEEDLDIQKILSLIPHRYPFILVDRVLEILNDNELVALKNVTINEPYFQGHFPERPVMPGVLQIEAMAQAAGILMLKRLPMENRISFFMSCDKVKFRQVVQPGDQLYIRAKIIKTRAGKIAVAETSCFVEGKKVSSAELMFTIVDTAG